MIRAVPPARRGAGAAGAPASPSTALLAQGLSVPLAAILEYLELLEDDGLLEDPALLRHYLAIVGGRARDLARIVAELTAFSDFAAGPEAGSAGNTPTSLPALARRLATRHPLRLEATAAAATAAVEWDRLRVALEHLLDYACRSGPPGSEVLVRATVEGDPERLVVRVVSAGPAIPQSQRAALAAMTGGGTPPAATSRGRLGPGLAVARRALAHAGGALDLEPGTPTTFRVELPLRGDPLARLTRELQGQAARADAQALQAIRDFRAAHRRVEEERRVRQQAEAQQLRTVEDFRAEHLRATALARRLDRAYLETITALARAVEARDSYTGGHVERVRSYSLHIADGLRLGGEALRALEVGALLHDVGKIGVQDAILRKPGGLDPEEWGAVRRHPEIGRRVLEGVSFLAPALEGVAYHHERWDGEGYPAGLAGEAIPLAGRIVAVADAYDAMTSDRSYRRGLPTEVALAEIEQGRGTQFDPDVAAAFLNWRAQRPGHGT